MSIQDLRAVPKTSKMSAMLPQSRHIIIRQRSHKQNLTKPTSARPTQLHRLHERTPQHRHHQSLGPLSSPEPDFNFDYHWLLTSCYQNGQHFSRRNPLFSNVLLLHKLLITGKGNLVVSRKAELDRDLLKKTCQYRPYSGAAVSKVS